MHVLQLFSWKHILDSLLCHFVIMALTICSWRGLFNVIGDVIFPGSTLLSDIVCLVAGFCLAVILLLLEELFARVTLAIEKEGFMYKLLFEGAVQSIASATSCRVWNRVLMLTPRRCRVGWQTALPSTAAPR